jgi:hypothetical protein
MRSSSSASRRSLSTLSLAERSISRVIPGAEAIHQYCNCLRPVQELGYLDGTEDALAFQGSPTRNGHS